MLEAHPLDIAEPWRELETAQVLRDGAFAHDLIFEATRKSVPRPIARLLHRRIAAHLLGARRRCPTASRRTGPARAEWRARRRGLRGGSAARARGLAARRTKSSAGASPPTRFDQAGAAELAFDARCESIHALIVVHGVTHAHTA